MKTLNMGVKKEISVARILDVTDRQPCWCARLDTEGFDPKWIISVKIENENIEHEFSLPNISHKQFNYMLSYDFAMKLIETFRNHGTYKVMEWVDNLIKDV